MWTLLMLALCSSLQSIAVGDGQLQRPPVLPTPYHPICKNNEEYQQCGCLRTCCNGGKPQGCAAQCTSGCFCKDGLVRNKNGVCIHLKDCNKTSGPPTPSCGVDEEYYDCVPTCRDTCETYNSKAAICPEYCRSGCFCKKGWVKNSVGKCVPTSQCNPPTKKPPRCPRDEEFYADCAPSCTGTCENYNKSGIFNCPLCRPGCWCKKGLVRAKDGKCIAPSKCNEPTECKGYNEVLVDCAKPKWCNTCGIKGNCKLSKCDKGCDCKPNYYRNETGICIPESQCPGSTPRCGEDEVYYKDCAPSCTGSCDTYGKEAVILCSICRPGCWCKQGLVKNKDGKCIPFSQCDKPEEECGAGEEYQECGTLCPRTCANLPYQIRCIAGCKTGCFCKEGLVRNYDNVCVKPEQCENKQCKVNEEYQKCGTACPETCSSLGKPQLCSTNCVSGCFCQEGFVKDDNGVCVEPSECPTEKCGVNEKYTTCGSACPETCENKDKTIFCTLQCVPGCFCIKGFVKNAQGKCINESQCEPTEQCGVNEIYKDCGSACPATCSNRGKRQVCTQQCVKGCFCKNGYIKNSNGRCVKPNECPKNQCGIDEVYDDCGTSCPRTCESLYTKIRCIETCVPGCFCRDDLVRHNGKCIDIRECQTQQCGANEEYKKCGSACTATCSNLDKPQVCTDQCVTGCFCKEGFVKNDNGECVEPSKCPSKTCGKNEEYTTCGPCVRTCDNKDKEIFCTQECRTGCFCKERYVRNKENKCVLPDQCPSVISEGFDCDKGPDTGPCKAYMPRFYYDQESGTCKPFIYGGCRGNKNNFMTEDQCRKRCGGVPERPDCDKAPDAGPCLAAIPRFYYDENSNECKPFTYGGCLGNSNNFVSQDDCYKKCGSTSNDFDCDKDPETGPCRARMARFYYDQDDGKCKSFIYGGCEGNKNNFKSKDECNKKCGNRCGVSEEYQTCGTACPDTCSNRGKPVDCTRQCVKGCFCKKGLVRNDTGKCVNPDKCPRDKCGFFEEYKKCGTACPVTCRNLNVKIYCVDECVEGCFCKEGLVRNDDGECVDPSDCPNEECGVNEQYSTCGSSCPVTCANKDINMNCSLLCVIGCFCKRGYIRNAEGICIPPDQCPSGTSNDFDCDKDPETGPCRARMARFYYDQDDGKCKSFIYGGCEGNKNNFKSKDECNKKCGNKCNGYNEALVDCAKPKWCNTCDIRGNCKLAKCDKGCDCKPNYYRNESGICIHKSQCPGQCGEDEVYNECGTACPRTCKNLNIKIACIAVCKKGCFCRDGLVRNDDGKCVEPSECPEKCGENENYYTCYTPCVVTCDNKDEQIFCTQECKVGCFCNKGYVRNREDKCVLPDQCPSEECNGYNEALVDCAKPKWCNTCIIKGNCKLANCERGCDCKPNYYRNGTGICIPESQCPGFCPLNEQYSDCVNPCNTCEIRGNCNFLVCNKGCDCKKGYYRDVNSNCIPAETCPMSYPPNPVCGVDEEYYNCTPDCKNTCEKYNKPDVACLKICRRGCFCKSGLVKRSDGKCVRPTDCDNEPVLPSERCGPREQYYDCIPNCHNTCETYNKTNIVCKQLCRQGCFCKEGYVLRKDKKCVRPAKCNLLPETCGKNEEYTTCGPCERTCDNKDEQIFCTQACRTGCFCKEGYVRNKENKCVLPDQCPSGPSTCGRHERYYTCIPNCRNTCETYKKNILCPQICRSGCFCKEGYVLRKDNKCVRPAKCNLPTEPEKCRGDEEYYEDCAPSCGGTCGREVVINCPPCRPGCWCKRGLIRSKDGKRCITPEECNAPTGCDFTQQYYDCMPDCQNRCNPPEFCDKLCRPGCFCRADLLLRDDNMCVREKFCNDHIRMTPSPQIETCGPKEEYYQCYSRCNNSCESYGNDQTVCPAVCERGCFCKRGLLMDRDGRCVTPAECEAKDVTSEGTEVVKGGEKESLWTDGEEGRVRTDEEEGRVRTDGEEGRVRTDGEEGRVRTDDEEGRVRTDVEEGRVRTDVEEGRVRTDDEEGRVRTDGEEGRVRTSRETGRLRSRTTHNLGGNLFPVYGSRNCDFNQQYYFCKPDCQNRCNPPNFCTGVCRPGCFCRQGLVLRADGMCVLKELCGGDTSVTLPPQIRCGPKKEYYECYSRCKNSCESYGNDQLVCPAVCERGCFCKRGLLVDRNGRCVTRTECEGCRINEEVVDCAKPKACNTCNIRGNCDLTNCTSGCDCIPGYYRDETRVCIPESECPQYNEPEDCGFNEEYNECGSACPLTCENYDQLIMCTLQCQQGCFCKEGFVRNAEGACILPSECPQARRKSPTRGGISPRRRAYAPFKRQPLEWVAQESYSDESGGGEFAGNGREREYSRNSRWTVYEDDDNADEEEYSERRVLSGSRTGALTQESYFTDYSEDTEDETGGSDEYMEWEEESEWVY